MTPEDKTQLESLQYQQKLEKSEADRKAKDETHEKATSSKIKEVIDLINTAPDLDRARIARTVSAYFMTDYAPRYHLYNP